jgi:ATP-dependent protease Clp ATPase subunit
MGMPWSRRRCDRGGYTGDDVESLLSRLLPAANGDLDAAQRGGQGNRPDRPDARDGSPGLRAVIAEVLEGVLFDIEAGIGHVVNEKTVQGGQSHCHDAIGEQ